MCQALLITKSENLRGQGKAILSHPLKCAHLSSFHATGG
jgi:hypothetical protein